MAEKKVVRYKLVRHKWPDEIKAKREQNIKRVLMVGSCIVCFVGGILLSNYLGRSTVQQGKEFSKFSEVYNIMNTKFYFGKDQENFEEKLITSAIDGMVSAGGDPHTSYMDAETAKSFTSSMEGSFVGIGIQYYGVNDSTFIVEKVFKDSPAEEAGMMKGDRIYAINGVECKGMTTEEVSELIKGETATKVEVEIVRENKHMKLDVARREVFDSVFSEIDGDTATLQINTFADSSGKEVGSHLADIKKAGVKHLVLDLRDNGGGYLDAAQQISSHLLPKDTVIFKEEGKDGKQKEYKTLAGYEQYQFDKIVILVNQNTASAAEVLTAALKEQLDASVVGVKTYGKGTVQYPLPFPDGSSIKYTIAEWVTPQGNKLNGKGIMPDYEVNLDPAITTSTPGLKKDEVYKVDTVSPIAKSVQIYLKFLGYNADRSDEYFSPTSSAALKKYQKDKGLPQTGNIDMDSVTSLLSSCSQKWHDEKDTLDLQMKKAMELVHGK